MTLYSILGFLAGVALLLTLVRYFLKKPSNPIIAFVQYFVAALFIFSGLIKENDTIGFSYKLEEYFEVFKTTDSVQVFTEVPVMSEDTVISKNETTGVLDTVISQKQTGSDKISSWTLKESDSFFNSAMDFCHEHALGLGFLVLVMEVIFGLMLLIGAWRNLTLLFLFLMIVFFTFLTYYSAAYNAVKECGCFGDFLRMTPWQSFGKDVLLLVLIIILFVGRKHIQPLFGPRLERGLLVIFLLFSFSFPLYTYNYLPIMDFRPYAIGKSITEGMKLPEGAKKDSVVMVFIYEKDGKKIDVSYDDVMKGKTDSTYKYIDRRDDIIVEGDKPAIRDFSISTPEGSDYTEQILNYDGYYFFLVCYDLDKTDKDVFGKVNDFAKLCAQDSIPIICLTASLDRIEAFKKETGSSIQFYVTDQVVLKTMIRSNPGLMLLKKGTVMDMWHHHCFPSFSDVKEKHFGKK